MKKNRIIILIFILALNINYFGYNKNVYCEIQSATKGENGTNGTSLTIDEKIINNGQEGDEGSNSVDNKKGGTGGGGGKGGSINNNYAEYEINNSIIAGDGGDGGNGGDGEKTINDDKTYNFTGVGGDGGNGGDGGDIENIKIINSETLINSLEIKAGNGGKGGSGGNGSTKGNDGIDGNGGNIISLIIENIQSQNNFIDIMGGVGENGGNIYGVDVLNSALGSVIIQAGEGVNGGNIGKLEDEQDKKIINIKDNLVNDIIIQAGSSNVNNGVGGNIENSKINISGNSSNIDHLINIILQAGTGEINGTINNNEINIQNNKNSINLNFINYQNIDNINNTINIANNNIILDTVSDLEINNTYAVSLNLQNKNENFGDIKINDNIITIKDSNDTGKEVIINDNIYSVYSGFDSSISNNKVNLEFSNSLSKINNTVYTAYLEGDGNLIKNEITIIGGNIAVEPTEDGVVQDAIISAYLKGNGDLSGNKITINGNTIINGNIKTAYVTGNGNLEQNELVINNGNVKKDIYNTYSTGNGNITKNKLTINNGNISENIYNTYTEGTGILTGNIANIKGGVIEKDLYNNYISNISNTGEIKENILTLSNGTISGDVYNIYTKGSGTLSENITNIEGGTIEKNLFAIYSINNSGLAENNKLNISKGTIKGDIFGICSSGNISKNEVSITGGTMKNLYNTYSTGNGNIAENKLTINNGNISENIYNTYTEGTGILTGNIANIKGGIIEKDAYNIYTKGSGALFENITNIEGGTIVADLYNIFVNNINNSGEIKKNKLTLNSGNTNNNLYNIYTNSTGEIKENILTLSNGTISGDVYNIYTKGSGTLSENITNIEGGTIEKNLFAIYSINNSGLAENNKLNISKGTIKGDVFGIYSSGNISKNEVSITGGTMKNLCNTYSTGNGDISENKLIITNGNILNNIYNIYTEGTGNIINNELFIVGGNISNDIYGIYTTNSSAKIDSSKIFIGHNVNTYGNIYAGVLEKTENKDTTIESLGDNNKIFVNKDLSYMENQGKGIYTGSGDNNYLYFFGKNINLLNNNIIRDKASIVLVNGDIIKNEINNFEIENKTNIVINKNIEYTNGNNIFFGDNISIDLYLRNIDKDNPIVLTEGSIKALDGASFISDNNKIVIDLQSLMEYNDYILFQANSIDNSLSEAFKLADKSFIKKIVVDKENNQIRAETYTNFTGVIKNEKNLRDISYLRSFTKSMDNAMNYMSQPERREKYRNEVQNKLLKDLIFVFNDSNSIIPIYKNLSFIEFLVKGWLPDLSGSVYKTSRDNFLHLTNRINSRFDNLTNYQKFDKENLINKYRKASYNYLIVKSMSDNQQIFEYDYSPLKTKRAIINNWFEIFNGEAEQKKNGKFDPFESDNTGFIFGKEFIFNDKVMFGSTFSYNLNKIKNIYKNINSNSFGVSSYLRYNVNDALYFNTIISYMYDSIDEKNKTGLNFNTTTNADEEIVIKDLKFKSDYGSNQFFTNFAIGLDSEFITQQIGLNYNIINTNSYKDNYNNSIDKNTYKSLVAFTSLTFKNFADIEYDVIKIKPKVFGRLNYGIIEADLKVSGRLNGNSKYDIKIGNIDEKNIQYGGNLDLEFFNFINMTLSYESVYGKKYKNNIIGLRANLLW